MSHVPQGKVAKKGVQAVLEWFMTGLFWQSPELNRCHSSESCCCCCCSSSHRGRFTGCRVEISFFHGKVWESRHEPASGGSTYPALLHHSTEPWLRCGSNELAAELGATDGHF